MSLLSSQPSFVKLKQLRDYICIERFTGQIHVTFGGRYGFHDKRSNCLWWRRLPCDVKVWEGRMWQENNFSSTSTLDSSSSVQNCVVTIVSSPPVSSLVLRIMLIYNWSISRIDTHAPIYWFSVTGDPATRSGERAGSPVHSRKGIEDSIGDLPTRFFER